LFGLLWLDQDIYLSPVKYLDSTTIRKVLLQNIPNKYIFYYEVNCLKGQVSKNNLDPRGSRIYIHNTVEAVKLRCRIFCKFMCVSYLIRFTAPEVLGGNNPTILSDIFSLGVLM
jgi:hypothetical protein